MRSCMRVPFCFCVVPRLLSFLKCFVDRARHYSCCSCRNLSARRGRDYAEFLVGTSTCSSPGRGRQDMNRHCRGVGAAGWRVSRGRQEGRQEGGQAGRWHVPALWRSNRRRPIVACGAFLRVLSAFHHTHAWKHLPSFVMLSMTTAQGGPWVIKNFRVTLHRQAQLLPGPADCCGSLFSNIPAGRFKCVIKFYHHALTLLNCAPTSHPGPGISNKQPGPLVRWSNALS